MAECFRITTDGRFYEVIFRFDKFSDCKRFILKCSAEYDRDCLTGTNFLVKNGFVAVLFFDASETDMEELDAFLHDLLGSFSGGFSSVARKKSDDVFWINELVRQSEFSLLGNADSVLMTFPDVWKL